MKVYIPSNEEMKILIREIVEETINEMLTDTIRESIKPEWLTTEEVMDLLSCSRPSIQKLKNSGVLPYHMKGKTVLYYIEDIEAFLDTGIVNREQLWWACSGEEYSGEIYQITMRKFMDCVLRAL